jgi:hypothetical protein
MENETDSRCFVKRLKINLKLWGKQLISQIVAKLNLCGRQIPVVSDESLV